MSDNFKVTFKDLDTCVIEKDSDFTWSEILKAVYIKHKRKVTKISSAVLQNNQFTGKQKAMFVFFENKFRKRKNQYAYYGWFKDEFGRQHTVVLHEETGQKGRKFLKGTLDFAITFQLEEKEKKAKGIIPDYFTNDPVPKVKGKRKLVPKKKELRKEFKLNPHKRVIDKKRDILPD